MKGNDVSATEIMAHALANSVVETTPEDYSIRRGSAFVNEYARTDPISGLRNDGGPSNPNDVSLLFFHMERGDLKQTDRSMSHMKFTPNGQCYMWTSAFERTCNFPSKSSAYAKSEKSAVHLCCKCVVQNLTDIWLSFQH